VLESQAFLAGKQAHAQFVSKQTDFIKSADQKALARADG
jgi:hypothetical protein